MAKNYANYIVDVNDFPKPGVVFKDITPMFENPKALNEALDDLEAAIKTIGEFDKMICCDARGFLFGVTMANRFNVPLVLARKPGKLPRPGVSASYALEYGTNTLQISEGSVKEGERVVVVDDLLATGGSANAVKVMVEKCNATLVGVATLIELDFLNGRKIFDSSVKVVSCIHY